MSENSKSTEIENVQVQIIVSQGLENNHNGSQQQQAIINPLKVVRTPYIPTSLSLAFTFIIIGLDKTKRHGIQVIIKHELTGKKVFNSTRTETMPLNTIDNMVISVDLKNVGFEKSGKYVSTILIDGKEYSDHFYVFQTSKN